MSELWKYFSEILRIPFLAKSDALQGFMQGVAHTMDVSQDDIVYLRKQFFPSLCEDAFVPRHGKSRGIERYGNETDAAFRQRVIDAYRWHLLGGKTLGLPEILKFYGYDEILIESMRQSDGSRWAEFQVNMQDQNGYVVLAGLKNLAWLINEYKPARSKMFRVYNHLYDFRPLIGSETVLSDCFYTFYSGVTDPDTGDLIISLGDIYSTQAELYGKNGGANAVLSQYAFLCPYVDYPTYSYFTSFDEFPQPHGFTVGQLLSVHWCSVFYESEQWNGFWENKPWIQKIRWDRYLAPWYMTCEHISKSQLVPSEQGNIGDINANYSLPTAVILHEAPSISDFSYSECPEFAEEIIIHEQYHQVQGIESVALAPMQRPTELFMDVYNAYHIPYEDAPIYGHSCIGEILPKNQCVFYASLSTHHGEYHFFADPIATLYGNSAFSTLQTITHAPQIAMHEQQKAQTEALHQYVWGNSSWQKKPWLPFYGYFLLTEGE